MNKNEMWVCAGDKLRLLRKEKGQSIFRVARQLGISGNYISEIEHGKKSPSEALIISLAEYYELDRKELFDMYGKEETEQAEDIKALPRSVRRTINQMSKDKFISHEDIGEAIKVLQRMADELKERE